MDLLISVHFPMNGRIERQFVDLVSACFAGGQRRILALRWTHWRLFDVAKNCLGDIDIHETSNYWNSE